MKSQPKLSQQSPRPEGPLNYQDVRVLLLSWEGGHGIDRIERDLHELGHVFKGFYKFNVNYWKIPWDRSTPMLNRYLLDFTENAHEGDLLIIYYAGHGKVSSLGHHLLWKW